ncbi:hypothetical protein Pme01_03790 [Planosporangium mesophilum]|uniref:Uncharacterized protein n=1 Tax=Planosporangium mesophilum TaxID=689768 RepID=A0A8J3WY41_9ACTN|nr:hypothetical protein Pme01_03790 [Planosporangium mesophilum]
MDPGRPVWSPAQRRDIGGGPETTPRRGLTGIDALVHPFNWAEYVTPRDAAWGRALT